MDSNRSFPQNRACNHRQRIMSFLPGGNAMKKVIETIFPYR